MTRRINSQRLSVNMLAAPSVGRLIEDAEKLSIDIGTADNGATIIDAGIDCAGGIEAGLRIAEICMGGLGKVSLTANATFRKWPWALQVHTANPVLACLGSQYAGWRLTHGKGKDAFNALGSGPARALAGREELFATLDYHDNADSACLILEADRRPPAALVAQIATDCEVAPDRLTLILAPTQSLAGTVQVVARVLEVALHKAHALGFALDRIVDGMGYAPLSPPAPDFITVMGRTNDAILFGGTAHLFVTGDDASARDLSRNLPSSASRDYGKPFAETYQSHKGDFFAIDPMLFSPARVLVSAVDSGSTFHAGALDEPLLDRSFDLIRHVA